MPVAITYARAEVGIDAPLVTVEADASPGLPQIQIVGLPQTAVRESKDRVRGALLNAGFDFPARRITINLAPADLPKLMDKLTGAPRKELLTFEGGRSQGDPCQALAYHGFNGLEAEVVQRIAGWIVAAR